METIAIIILNNNQALGAISIAALVTIITLSIFLYKLYKYGKEVN
jgi:hypothetical protein